MIELTQVYRMAAPLKLLSISHSYVVGVNRRLVAEMARVGAGEWEITALSPDRFVNSNTNATIEAAPETDQHWRLLTCPVRFPNSPHLFRYSGKFNEILRQRWDVIHAWEEPYVLAGSMIARHSPADAALVFASFQNIAKRFPIPFNWIEQKTMRRVDGWIAFGRSAHEVLGARRGYENKLNACIPPGVDTAEFYRNAKLRESTIRSLNWPNDGAPVIGILGRLVVEKGVRVLMTALEQLAVPWRLLVVGDGPLSGDVDAFARKFPDRVRRCAAVSHEQVPAYLNGMDMLVAPSLTRSNWREQFGRMIIEAFACGVPVIGSDSGEIPHVIGPAGIVVRESDPAALAAAIRSLIESPDRRAELSMVARQRAENEFAWPIVAARTLEFMRQVVDRKNAAA